MRYECTIEWNEIVKYEIWVNMDDIELNDDEIDEE